MPYTFCVLCLLLLARELPAQPAVNGLGTYIIGQTTPDSLKGTGFREEGPAYVKGTIALVCVHIRTFKASSVVMEGVVVPDMYLFFYDNNLFRISCQYTPELADAFVRKYGKGTAGPLIKTSLCPSNPALLMQISRDLWQQGDVSVLAVHAKGYTGTCELAEEARLIIESQRFSALSSDCDLKNTYYIIGDTEKTP